MALVVGAGRLFGEVEPPGHAGRLQHVSAGLFAPASATAGVAAQGLGQFARLVARGRGGRHQGRQLFAQAARLFRTGLLQRGDMLLEPGQGVGDGFQLGGHPFAGQLVLRAEGFGGAADHLVGDDLGRLGGLGLEQFGHGHAAVLDRLHPRLGRRQFAARPLPPHEGPKKAARKRGGEEGENDDDHVHAPFLAGVAGDEKRPTPSSQRRTGGLTSRSGTQRFGSRWFD